MKEYDSDGDGVLRGDEVRRWLIPDVKTVAKQEASHLITEADKDKVRFFLRINILSVFFQSLIQF